MTDADAKSALLVYSEADANKARLSETIQHPLTLWPTAGGVIAISAGVLTLIPLSVALTLFGAGLLIGGGNWCWRYFGQGEAYLRNYFNKCHTEFEKAKNKKLKTLGRDLKRLGCTEGDRQSVQFEEKFKNLLTVLGRVLSPTELTYSRYKVTAEQVYSSGLDNLESILTILTNISDIDRDFLGDRIKYLQQTKELAAADEKTLKTLKERAALFDSAQEKVKEYLASNEEALTAIDSAGMSISNIRKQSSQSIAGDLSGAMEDLVGLVNRARSKSAKRLSLEI